MIEDIKEKYSRVYVYSSGIYKNKEIQKMFHPLEWVKMTKDTRLEKEGSVVVVWGRKPNTDVPTMLAKEVGIPVIYMEDGFLRSWGLGISDSPPKSLIFDQTGIYYDATRVSDLEILCNKGVVSQNQRDQSRKMIDKIVSYKLSKYNNSDPVPKHFAERVKGHKEKKVLVIGQVEGDMSLKYGLCKYKAEDVLEIAIRENPEAKVFYKVHPDVLNGKSGQTLSQRGDVQVIKENYNPVETLDLFDKVYVMTSQMGFEALMLGKEVVCMGAPFYSNWGLTDDRYELSRRKVSLDIESLFYYAYVEYPRYLNGSLEATVEELNAIRSTKKDVLVYGLSLWKRSFFEGYFQESENVHYIEYGEENVVRTSKFTGQVQIVVWGKKSSEKLEKYARQMGYPVLSVEDGFLRSVNLGVEKTIPASLCFDSLGIYYDATKPSELEKFLNEYDVPQDQLQRAEVLMRGILDGKLSKYNNARHVDFDKVYGKKERHRVLVIGQVEGDMSLKYGCEKKMSNNELVRLARAENPESQIFYKIHPDVLGKETDSPSEVEGICEILDCPMSAHSVLEGVDKVYTMTSLMGMEALVRGKEVVCVGAPFYSNWGLTDDRQIVERRKRRRTLAELFAIAYIVYPRYMDVATRRLATPETVVENLVSEYKNIQTGGKDMAKDMRGIVKSYLKYGLGYGFAKVKGMLG